MAGVVSAILNLSHCCCRGAHVAEPKSRQLFFAKWWPMQNISRQENSFRLTSCLRILLIEWQFSSVHWTWLMAVIPHSAFPSRNANLHRTHQKSGHCFPLHHSLLAERPAIIPEDYQPSHTQPEINGQILCFCFSVLSVRIDFLSSFLSRIEPNLAILWMH